MKKIIKTSIFVLVFSFMGYLSLGVLVFSAVTQNISDAFTVGCDNNSTQVCTVNHDKTFTMSTSGTASASIQVGPNHCSAIKVTTYVDNVLIGTTPFLGWVGDPQSRPLTSSLFNNLNLSTGSHKISLKAEGTPGGCNNGFLSSWGGTLNIQTNEIPPPTNIKVHIYKYLPNADNVSVQVPDNSTAPAFPMTATWKTANLNGGVSTSGTYVLGNNHGGAALKYAADTAPMNVPADYTTSEIKDGTVVVSNIDSCSAGKYYLQGYKSGDSLVAAQGASISSTPPVFSGLTADKFLIALNKICDTPAPIITNISISSPSSTSVIIMWTTDHVATSRVVYDTVSHPTVGLPPNYGYAFSTVETDTPVSPNGVTSHSVTITGLTPSTIYYFRPISHGSPEAVGGEVSTTTPTQPIISSGGGGVSIGGGTSGGGGGGSGGNTGTTTTTTTTGSSGSGGDRSNSNGAAVNIVNTQPAGQVLGAQTSCGIYINKFLRKGYKNDTDAVKKLQQFLNNNMKVGLVVDGVFGSQLETAVKAFQLAHADTVLAPWHITVPTGIFYITTQIAVNNAMCETLKLPIPKVLIPFNQNPEVLKS